MVEEQLGERGVSKGEGGGCVGGGVMPNLWKTGWLVKVGIGDRSGGILGGGHASFGWG